MNPVGDEQAGLAVPVAVRGEAGGEGDHMGEDVTVAHAHGESVGGSVGEALDGDA